MVEPNPIFDILFANVLPFAAFFIGVIIAESVGLYPKTARKSVWLLSIPTGLVTTGLLMSSASLMLMEGNTNIVKYGYMASIPKYAIFLGIVIFYGTAVPELFVAFRKRLIRNSDLGLAKK